MHDRQPRDPPSPPLLGRPSTDPLHRLRRFGSVQLRVDLRHDRGGMAQDGPGHVQAELPTEPSRRVVAELVGVPAYRGSPAALAASVLDGPAVGIDGVSLARGPSAARAFVRFRWEGWTRVFRVSPRLGPPLGLRLGRVRTGRPPARPGATAGGSLGLSGRDRSAAPGRDAPSCGSRECRSRPGRTCRGRSSA